VYSKLAILTISKTQSLTKQEIIWNPETESDVKRQILPQNGINAIE
jgi:hypothetical protein